MRLISWNVLQGGGRRAERILHTLESFRADVLALSEMCGNRTGALIQERLRDLGFSHLLCTAPPEAPRKYGVLIASRWPLTSRAPGSDYLHRSTRWLSVEVGAPSPFTLIKVHVPNRGSGEKFAFYEEALDSLEVHAHEPALFVGDMNTGLPGLDEERPFFNAQEKAWMDQLAAAGWSDLFRERHPEERVYSWYSGAGNGFRLDHAFGSVALGERRPHVSYSWGSGTREEWPSDHAAVVVELGEGKCPTAPERD